MSFISNSSLSSFKINNGSSNTSSRTVTLNNSASGSPTHYMASQSSNFSVASWLTYSTSPSFTLSSGNGTKTVYLKVKNSAGESTAKNDSISLNEIDNKPYYSSASLPSSATRPNKIYFSGCAKDDKGLSVLTMKVSGPKGNNRTAFTKTISGTSHKLSSYYFDSKNTSYANVAGSYTVALWIKDSPGQTASKTFSIRVRVK